MRRQIPVIVRLLLEAVPAGPLFLLALIGSGVKWESFLMLLGAPTKVIMCTHRFDQANTAHFPKSLRDLTTKGPVPDVHTFLRMETSSGWMDVDATWPARACGQEIRCLSPVPSDAWKWLGGIR